MPIATLQIAEGRSQEQKNALLINVTHAIAESLDAPVENIRVIIPEISETQSAAGGIPLAERRAAKAFSDKASS